MAWLRLIFKLALNIKYLTRSKIGIESEEQAGSRSNAVAIETPTVTLHYYNQSSNAEDGSRPMQTCVDKN